MKIILVAAILFLTILNVVRSDNDLGLEVYTIQGTVLGQFESGYRSWKGIPYGQATRFEFSEFHDPWDPESFPAYAYGPSCPQNYQLSTYQSEDCLYLNVWAPPYENTENGLLPVMVFIHGGAFVQGHGAIALYSGAIFANTSNQVLVSLNYRLGALGFLAGGADLNGNYGFQDQQLALKWVQQNIAGFGGDPNQITLFGESAGGSSVAYQLVSPSSAGLFQRTIVESNPTGILLRTIDDNSPYFVEFATEAKCLDGEIEDKIEFVRDPMFFEQTRECLMNLSIPEILDAQGKTKYKKVEFARNTDYLLPFIPVIDGNLIPDQPMTLYAKGAFHQLPTIWGTNANESGYLTYKMYPNVTLVPLEYDALIDVAFGNDSKEVKDEYPATLFKARDSLTNLITDFLFYCPTRYAIRQIAQYAPVHSYVFDYSPQFDPFSDFAACWAKPQGEGLVCHGAELPFVFRTYNIINDPFNQNEIDLSIVTQGLWSSFSNQTLNNNPTLPYWPIYNTTADQLLRLKDPSDIVTGWRSNYCDFWDGMNIYN